MQQAKPWQAGTQAPRRGAKCLGGIFPNGSLHVHFRALTVDTPKPHGARRQTPSLTRGFVLRMSLA